MVNDNEILNIVSNREYLTPVRYLSGRIVEYDMKAANISVLRQLNAIDDNYYRYLSSLPKGIREKDIGLMIRSDRSYYNIINDGVTEYKKQFAIANNLNPMQIMRVANDAIYVNTPYDLTNLKFDEYIEFRPKSVSNVMMKLDRLVIFLSFGSDNDMNVDVKGLGENLFLHQDYFLAVIATLIGLIERSTLDDAFRYIDEFTSQYLNKQLPIEYYRTFDSSSVYMINMGNNVERCSFGITGNVSIDNIDINYNLYILREIWSILTELKGRLERN